MQREAYPNIISFLFVTNTLIVICLASCFKMIVKSIHHTFFNNQYKERQHLRQKCQGSA
jgi:maltodextrin utilization protein YvdJ